MKGPWCPLASHPPCRQAGPVHARLILLAAAGSAGLDADRRVPDAAALAAAERVNVEPAQRVLLAPSPAAHATAEALGLTGMPDAALRDIDVGRWAGADLACLAAEEAEGLAAWAGDAHAVPHGGESLASLVERVAAWLAAQTVHPGRTLAIASTLTVRAAVAALVGTPDAVFVIDVAPLTAVTLVGNGQRWTLRGLVPP